MPPPYPSTPIQIVLGRHKENELRTKENNAIITIKDSGVGIPAEALPSIFKRFYRVDSARTKIAGGSGLGLAIVKSIMELHGGKISIESEVGKGALVTLFFPLST